MERGRDKDARGDERRAKWSRATWGAVVRVSWVSCVSEAGARCPSGSLSHLDLGQPREELLLLRVHVALPQDAVLTPPTACEAAGEAGACGHGRVACGRAAVVHTGRRLDQLGPLLLALRELLFLVLALLLLLVLALLLLLRLLRLLLLLALPLLRGARQRRGWLMSDVCTCAGCGWRRGCAPCPSPSSPSCGAPPRSRKSSSCCRYRWSWSRASVRDVGKVARLHEDRRVGDLRIIWQTSST